MDKKEILLLLTDRWADWEAGYAITELHSFCGFEVRTISPDSKPKVSMGGVRAEIDCTLDEYTRASIIWPC